MTDFSVPVVDISAYVDPARSAADRQAAARAFDEAARLLASWTTSK